MRNTDKMLLENLIRKYGANNIKKSIIAINESFEYGDWQARGFETQSDLECDIERRIKESGMTKEELEFLKEYPDNVYAAQDYVSDMCISCIHDPDAKAFAIKKKNRILAEIDAYKKDTDKLIEKYGRQLVSDVINMYDYYSN